MERQPASVEVTSPPGINDVVRQVVGAQPWPSYISDGAWDVVAYNNRLVTWFPWIPYNINIMLWVFTYPEAQRQLHDWETKWAPPMLAQMRMARAADPDNERLATVIDEILRQNRFARHLWESQHAGVVWHPDGHRRQVRVPPHGTIQTVEIVASTLFRAPNTRMLMMVPVDD